MLRNYCSHRDKIVGLIWSFAIEMQMSEYVVHDVCAKEIANMQRSCQECRGHIKVLATMYCHLLAHNILCQKGKTGLSKGTLLVSFETLSSE